MEKGQLERYRSQREEIRELQYKLAHLGVDDSLIGNSIVFDYSTGYPRPQAVVGYDYEKESRLKERYAGQIRKLQADCADTEKWIEEIPDSLIRRIFRLRYIDGMTQQQVGKQVHLDRSRVSKKIDDFLKNAHKAQKAHL